MSGDAVGQLRLAALGQDRVRLRDQRLDDALATLLRL